MTPPAGTVSRRRMIGVADLPAYLEAGYVVVYFCDGARRIDGDAVVVEWRMP